MSDLQPLPQSALTAACLRRMAHEMLLQAEALEAEAGLHKYQPKRQVEFEFSKEKIAARKPMKKKKA